MSDVTYRVGQRLSLKSQRCTVRYYGKVANKIGDWLGVEWDDTTRGKNDGKHEEVRYFKCRSKSSTAASFLRPTQSWDTTRTFLEALTDKYFKVEEAKSGDLLFVSRSKQIEEVGFEKFALRQAELKGIHVLVLDRMCIASHIPAEDQQTITKICTNITDLDLGGNLFEDLEDVLGLCCLLPKLKRLTLDSNRLAVQSDTEHVLEAVRTICLADTLLNETELAACLTRFPQVEELIFADNALTVWDQEELPQSLRSVNLAHNSIPALNQITSLLALPQLRQLSLKDNDISRISKTDSQQSIHVFSKTLQELDLGHNNIADWHLFDYLLDVLPILTSLRVSGNPLYSDLRSAEDKPLAAEDGYMLTVARLPSVHTLNYSTVRKEDRLNAEKYYLSQIAAELSRTTPADVENVISRHPRWKALCNEYGEPAWRNEKKTNDVDPNSLAARLVTIQFYVTGAQPGRKWTVEVPRAYNIYALYGLVGKELDAMPLSLRLVWETGERDPVSHKAEYRGPEGWDSDDEEDELRQGEAWTMRLVELVPGTRPVGTYLEERSATVRVEVL